MARRFVSRFRHLVPGAAALVCAAALACAGKSVRSDEDGDSAGEGGTQASGGNNGGTIARGGVSGTSTGGSVSTGGASGTAAGGASGTATGGASGTRGGSSGSATGGTSTGGSTNTCATCTRTMCTTTILPTQVINDFQNLYFIEDGESPIGLFGVLDEQGMLKPEWWLGYFSGTFAYPTIPESCSGEPRPMFPLTREETGGILRVTGTVGGPSGFGIWLGPCIIDMSAGYGIMFRLGGRAGSGKLEMKVGTSSTTDPDACQIGRGKCSTDVCTPPSARLDIVENPEAFALGWITFGDAIDPREVVELRWDFEWVGGMAPYAVDVTLDNVMLIE